MEDQQLYKTHVVSNSNNNVYYHPMQHQVLGHSYDSLDMNASESSSSSPHLSQDSRDVPFIPGAKNAGQAEASSATHWASANHLQERSHLNCFDQSLPWSSQAQGNVTDANHTPYYTQHDSRPKTDSGAFHKLDSFTQVFAKQNLRIHSMSQGVPEQLSFGDSDSTLRQLLSFRPASDQQQQQQQPAQATMAADRYPQVSQQMHQGVAHQQHKHQTTAQSHIYYDYFPHASQGQSQGHAFGQHAASHQSLPQDMLKTQYYMQQTGHQRLLVQDLKPPLQQQQRQFTGPMSQYYQMQPTAQDMHRNVPQSRNRHLQLQQSLYDADGSSKAEPYVQEPAHSMHLIQLGAMPQYLYQNAQTLRYTYKQSMGPKQQLQPDVSPQKPYNNEAQLPALPSTDTINAYNQEDLGVMSDTGHQQHLLAQDNSYFHGSQSPGAVWPQHMSDGKPQTISPDNRLYPDQAESKSRLTCSVCLKEFKSLPALNGHLRSHGGVRAAATPKQEEGKKPEASQEDTPGLIVMPVSVPVTLAAPEPAEPLSCKAEASDEEMPVLTRMTYSPPSSPKTASSCASSEITRKVHHSATKVGKPEESTKPQQERRRYRHRPEPLFIPPPSFCVNPSYSGATLYQSQLRSPCVLADCSLLRCQEMPTYTPPPMLSPVRQGSGLFSSVIAAAHNAHLPLTPLTPTPRVLLRTSSIDGTSATPGPGEHTVDVEPRINIGAKFQAEIPDLQPSLSLKSKQHRATLVWKPWPELEREESQQKVDVFLSMSCSSVLPGGGTNLEYALHALFEAKGNIMSALEMLLLNNTRLKGHPLANYHYAGSDHWTSTEKKSFNKALNTCNKDFFHVQKMIKTKTVSQCVEYYYTWKKILHIGRRQRSRLVELHEEDTTSIDDMYEDEDLEDRTRYEQKSPDLLHPAERELPATNLGPPIGSFVCEMGNCGAVFCSRQALNGHARIHGGTGVPNKGLQTAGAGRQKSGAQSGYGSVKSSPAHSTTSGETDAASIFPCKVCGKVFFKIKSRNAHMKTHRQQEEQQRQRSQKAAAEMEETIAQAIAGTTPPLDTAAPFDHFSLMNSMEEDFDEDVAQDLEDVLEETEVMHSDLILDDEDVDLLQDATDL